MAKGKTQEITKIVNNKLSVTSPHTVELIVINGRLDVDPKDINPGVIRN